MRTKPSTLNELDLVELVVQLDSILLQRRQVVHQVNVLVDDRREGILHVLETRKDAKQPRMVQYIVLGDAVVPCLHFCFLGDELLFDLILYKYICEYI